MSYNPKLSNVSRFKRLLIRVFGIKSVKTEDEHWDGHVKRITKTYLEYKGISYLESRKVEVT